MLNGKLTHLSASGKHAFPPFPLQSLWATKGGLSVTWEVYQQLQRAGYMFAHPFMNILLLTICINSSLFTRPSLPPTHFLRAPVNHWHCLSLWLKRGYHILSEKTRLTRKDNDASKSWGSRRKCRTNRRWTDSIKEVMALSFQGLSKAVLDVIDS